MERRRFRVCVQWGAAEWYVEASGAEWDKAMVGRREILYLGPGKGCVLVVREDDLR